ncbi:ATP-dependent carboligase [Sinorhizobium meliloti]|nr:ATP-dependent carboligase [Sinorhizobium meliloti]
MLEPLVAGREGAIRLSEEVQADGDEFFRVACAHGLEGIIAKHIEKPYRSGRGEWWQKITCKRRDSFVVVGFEPSNVPGHIGRLLLAARKDGDLVYVGGCGTGWSNELSRELRKLLEGMVTKSPAVALKRKNAIFTEPLLVAEVEYRAWTEDRKLRHASFKGIRPREDDPTVYHVES